MAKASDLNQRLRLAGLLILSGLVIEAVSFSWNSPFSFFLFIIGSGLLLGFGIVIFLWALVERGETSSGSALSGQEHEQPDEKSRTPTAA